MNGEMNQKIIYNENSYIYILHIVYIFTNKISNNPKKS